MDLVGKGFLGSRGENIGKRIRPHINVIGLRMKPRIASEALSAEKHEEKEFIFTGEGPDKQL